MYPSLKYLYPLDIWFSPDALLWEDKYSSTNENVITGKLRRSDVLDAAMMVVCHVLDPCRLPNGYLLDPDLT